MILSVCLPDTSLSHEINSTPQLLVENFRITQTKEILTGKRAMFLEYNFCRQIEKSSWPEDAKTEYSNSVVFNKKFG